VRMYRIRIAPSIGCGWLVILILGCTACSQQAAFPVSAESLLADFRSDEPPTLEAYDKLFAYFVTGFVAYRMPAGSMALYPGLPSTHGRTADRMEGFSRIAPLWGAWVASGRSPVVRLATGKLVDLNAAFEHGLVTGVDRRSAGYWGDIRDLDQRIVEAADIALSIWLFRDTAWSHLSPAQKRQVVSWLCQVNGKSVPDSNWHLFVTFVNVVLERLGYPADRNLALQHYSRMKQFYRGEGWFSDGPGNVFDYYNAWGIHYQLYWLQQVAPEWDSGFIEAARRQFVGTYRFLVGAKGVPILGRSICYRMAAVAPLVFACGDGGDPVSPGEARRALDLIWSYFIRNGAVQNGNVTQGYCGADARILDTYSGPASCLWALRSLIVAFYKPPSSSFWEGTVGRLPVEKGDYSLAIGATGWQIRGVQQTRTVQIQLAGADHRNDEPLKAYSLWRRIASTILRRPFRPDNMAAKYWRATYESDHPFCGCLDQR
jgi:hypothetical protein